jgi:Flp pilus assembly protein TadD
MTALVVFLAAFAPNSQGWAGDEAAKSAAGDLKKGYEAAKRGYWQEARARYEHASKIVPGDPEVWSNLGVALEATGHYDEAGDAYLKALEIDPGNSKIRRNFGMFNEFYASYIANQEDLDKEAESPAADEETDPADGEESSDLPDGNQTKEAGDASLS